MHLLFICATAKELQIVKKQVKHIFSGYKYSFLCSGKGNYSTIASLTRFLEKHTKIDFAINIGVCGWKNEKHDCIQIGRIKNLANNKELIPPLPFICPQTHIASIACSETVVYQGKILKEENYVDMESYGCEYVLDYYKIPRIFLKIPVDKIGKETRYFNYEKAQKLLKENIPYEQLKQYIATYFRKHSSPFDIVQEKNKQAILQAYPRTVSEEQQVKYFINRSLVLNTINLQDFLQKYKHLNKKEFLEKLRKIQENFLSI